MNIQRIEYSVILAVLGLLGWLYFRSRGLLAAQRTLLDEEESALEKATQVLSFNRLRESGVGEVEGALERGGSDGSAVALRVRALSRGAVGFGEGGLVNVEEARFWTGAFVFIGLIGTLVCLTIAVLNLIALVRGAGATGGAGTVSSFQGVVQSMTNVFSGMGVAFASTALGTSFTLLLGRQVNAVENSADGLETRIERFLALEVGPLVSLAREKRRASAQNEEVRHETARLESAAKLLESAATGLAQAIGAAKNSIQNLGDSSTQAGGKMERAADLIGSSAARFADGADALTGMTGELDKRLERLGALIEEHNGEQNKWRDGTDGVLRAIGDTVGFVEGAFLRFDTARAALEAMNQNTDRMLEKTHQLADSIDANSRSAAARLGEESQSSLGEIRRAIETGNEQERQLFEGLRALCAVLGDYAQHVEDEIRRLPLVVGSEPLFAFEQRESDGWKVLGSELTLLRGEFARVGERMEGATNGGVTGAEFYAGLGGVESRLDGIQKAIPGGTPQLGEMKSQIGALQESVGAVNSDVRRLSLSVSAIQTEGVPIRWPWNRRN